MAFKFSMSGAAKAKADKVKAEEELKLREEEAARKKRDLAKMLEQDDHENSEGHAQQSNDRDAGVFVPTGTKRHYAGRARSTKSGPGTLDSGPPVGSAPQGRFGGMGPSRLGGPVVPAGIANPIVTRNDEAFTNIIAKVSNLPPGTKEKTVEELFAGYNKLKVTKVERVPPSGPSTGRPSLTMKVTFQQDAGARDLEEAMGKLGDKKYLGSGYYVHIDRYLGDNMMHKEPEKLPFNAQWVKPEAPKGIAPTAELGGRNDRREPSEELIITAFPPPDIDTLKLIHTTINFVIKGGFEFEAALMEDPKIQKDERYVFLYDNDHPLHRYYRFRMYQIATGNTSPRIEIYKGLGTWVGAEPFPDEFAGRFEHMDPDAMETDDDEEYSAPKTADSYPSRTENATGIMSPKSKQLLVFLLCSMSTIKGANEDIGAITYFATQNANKGMQEIISLLVTNVMHPLCMSEANPDFRPPEPGEEGKFHMALADAMFAALHILSDVLDVAAKQDGKCYKYREAIGAELERRKVFEYLDAFPEKCGLTRISENSFRETINKVIHRWRDDVTFVPAIVQQFDDAFNWRSQLKSLEHQQLRQQEKRSNVPRAQMSQTAAFEEAMKKNMSQEQDKPQESKPAAGDNDSPGTQPNVPAVAQAPSEVNRSEQPASSSPNPGPLSSGGAEASKSSKKDDAGPPGETAAARAKRLRPKAEDMFGSDDDE